MDSSTKANLSSPPTLLQPYRLCESKVVTLSQQAQIGSVTMKREFLPIETLPSWAVLNDVSADGVAFRRLRSLEDGTDKGSAIVATRDRRDDGSGLSPQVLLTIPLDMVLSLQSVENHAKSDGSLREVLDAVGDYGRVGW